MTGKQRPRPGSVHLYIILPPVGDVIAQALGQAAADEIDARAEKRGE